MMAGSCAALRTRMEIRIGVSEQMAPYQFLDNQGQLAGIHYDLLACLKVIFHHMAVELRKQQSAAAGLLHDKSFAAEQP